MNCSTVVSKELLKTRKNQSLNSVVWSLCPKESFAGLNSVETACAMAVARFNDGSNTSGNIMKRCGLNPGKYVSERTEQEDTKRIYHAERKTREGALTARKQRRTERRHQEERNIENEGETQKNSSRLHHPNFI